MSAAIDNTTIDDSSPSALRSGEVDEVDNQQPSGNDENIDGPVRYEGLICIQAFIANWSVDVLVISGRLLVINFIDFPGA